MRTAIRAAALAAAVTMLAATAQAGNVPRLQLPSSALPAAPVTGWSFSGWYVRGDIGWRLGLIGDVDAPGAPDPANNQLGDALTAGGGIGIRHDFLRTDITIDYSWPADYTGSAITPNDTSAKIRSVSVLANGYLDLGTWYRLTPYVGAGAGAALLKVSSVQSAVPSANHSRWNFAWAGMAGVAWTVAPNVQIDFGYRYLNLGDAKSGGPGEITFDNVGGHEIRVGLRWHYDDLREFRF